jgi:hypothetical protein
VQTGQNEECGLPFNATCFNSGSISCSVLQPKRYQNIERVRRALLAECGLTAVSRELNTRFFFEALAWLFFVSREVESL